MRTEVSNSTSGDREARSISQSYIASEASALDKDGEGASTTRDKKIVTIKGPDSDVSQDSRSDVFNVTSASKKSALPEKKNGSKEDDENK